MNKSTWILAIVVAVFFLPESGAAQEPVYWDVVDDIRTEGFDNCLLYTSDAADE